MLTDSSKAIQSGRLDQNIHLPSTSKLEIIAFITKELPLWRDHPDRPNALAETKLTEQLCEHLNSAAYYSDVWNHIQFRTETSDEVCGGRKIDLAVKPLAAAFIIEGRRHSQFDALFPIECKRLPTPKEKDRDEREYVISEYSTTGGIQRFKFGHHGAAHNFAAMIGYIQEQSFPYWLNKVNSWILDLAAEAKLDWSNSEILKLLNDDSVTGTSTFISRHERKGDLDVCELQHLWVRMH